MAGWTERLYFAAPVWAQQAMVASYGWWWKRRRFGPAFHAALPALRERQGWSAEALRDEQRRLLRDLFAAARSSPYYAPLLADLDAEEDPLAVLPRLPLLDKQTLRRRGRDLLTGPVPRDTMVFRSSGTTGTPTEIFFRRDFHQLVQAFFEVRIREWAGIIHRDRRAMFGVRKVCRPGQSQPPFWRRSPAEDLAYYSIYHMSPENLPAYAEHLTRFRPTLVSGYPNALTTVASFVLENGIELPPARAVITTSETVTAEIRDRLERAWSCPVYDNYCAVEASVLASQCEEGRYHVSPDFGFLEILDAEGRPCAPGELGEVVTTGLQNTLQPLIRYRIGDVAAWSEEEGCPCGRDMPMIRSIEGRLEDVCVTTDGRRLVRFDTVFKGITTIREGQVVQKARDRFVLKVVPTEGFGERDRRRLVANMALHVGDAETEVETVDAIPRTAAGKFRPVVSEVE